MKKILILALAVMALTVACKKETPTGTVLVETLDAEALSPLSIVVKGKLSPELRGSSSVTNWGFYWGTDPSDLGVYNEGGELTNGEFSAKLSELPPNSKVWYKAYCRTITTKFYGDVKSLTVPSFEEVVDLGLSVKWRAWNLGASRPEEYGDYYAWGEIEPYYTSFNPLVWKRDKEEGYGWSSYSLSDGGSFMTKYYPCGSRGKIDFRTQLTTGRDGDDVASVLLGGNWRMPTVAELDELLENCTPRWDDLLSARGVRLYSNKPGFTDNFIFIPNGGFFVGRNFNDCGANEAGIWSSSIDPDDPFFAYYTGFATNYAERHKCLRYFGHNIRPVLPDAPTVAVTSISLSQTSLTMKPGQLVSLSATVYPSNAAEQKVFWTSSDSDIASIYQGDKILAGHLGKATITAGCGGVTATCEVEVTE